MATWSLHQKVACFHVWTIWTIVPLFQTPSPSFWGGLKTPKRPRIRDPKHKTVRCCYFRTKKGGGGGLKNQQKGGGVENPTACFYFSPAPPHPPLPFLFVFAPMMPLRHGFSLRYSEPVFASANRVIGHNMQKQPLCCSLSQSYTCLFGHLGRHRTG